MTEIRYKKNSNNIAILIASYNRVNKTYQCLTSLYNALLPPGISFDVYLVDDASTDLTVELISYSFPSVNIIIGSGNLFWGGATSLAWNIASIKKYQFYIWLNNDTYVFRNFFSELLSAFHSVGGNSIIVGVTKSKKNNDVTYGGYKYGSHHMHIPCGTVDELEIINGNAVLIPRIIYEKIGNLDNKFKHGLADRDNGLRAIKNGYKCFSTSKIIAFCENDHSIPKCFDNGVYFFSRLKFLYNPLSYAQPKEQFIFLYRHFGIIKAIKSFISIHLRAINPELWQYIKYFN